MMIPVASLWLLWSVLPLIAIAIALLALRAARGRPGEERSQKRIADLEARVRVLLERVWLLEQAGRPRQEPAPGGVVVEQAPAGPITAPAAGIAAPVSPIPVAEPATAVAAPAAPAQAKRGLDLEQRIGARWTTWVGVVLILFGISFFLRWSFESNLIGPGGRVILGLIGGAALLAAGLSLHRRRDVPYLSEGLSGGGLATLYLSLYAAHAVYGLLAAIPAFSFMFVVTGAGAAVAVASNRQVTAVLTLLGGLLTPLLLATDRPDERILLGYLLVLDLLVLAVARSRSWPTLNRLAWAGTVVLAATAVLRPPGPPYPLTRLVLLSALFALFLAVPLARSWMERQRVDQLDLALAVGNGAAYFWAVYLTLEPWQAAAAGPYALAQALLYALVAAAYRKRVPEDEPTVLVHLGVSVIFLTLAIPLILDGPWVTLVWAAIGVLLLAMAPSVPTPVASWGGLAALLLASFRALAFDPYWYPPIVPVRNVAYLIHLLVVAALAVGGSVATSVPGNQVKHLTSEGLRSVLWVLAALLLAVLFWSEPRGLWPAALLTAAVLALGWLARTIPAPAFLIATPLVAMVLLARIMVEDAEIARGASARLINAPLLVRIAACGALALAGSWLARSQAAAAAAPIGRALSSGAGALLLIVLSLGWTQHQEVRLRAARSASQWELAGQIEWTAQVGLSVLWTLYAAATLGWGFVRSLPAVRYAALGLFALVIAKVFLVDLSSVQTVYRIVSFLILGVVLLGVSVLYQKARKPVA